MTLDKSKSTTEKQEIVFNWERTKKQAQKKIDELVCNAPRISRREQAAVLKKQTARLVGDTKSGDYKTHTVIDNCIMDDECHVPNTTTQRAVESSTKSGALKPTSNTEPIKDISIDSNEHTNKHTNDSTNTLTNDTPNTLLLAGPPAQQSSSEKSVRSEKFETEVIEIGDRGVITTDALGPDTNAIDLLKQIKGGEVVGKDLQKDERQVVVKALRMAGQTQDAIASLLKVSRRTIVADCKSLRQLAALEIQSTETAEIAGEVYTIAQAAMTKALQKGHLKTVSTLMRDMVELLQSMGMVYRAPKTSMQATMHGSINRSKGYQKYIDTIGQDRNKVVEILDSMFDAISKEEV